ncbi:MAG: phosphate/phosphite/phosphonate ABC transporter substrate-binding protein [Anaerolineales bacterium]|nr:phosphate/phosphite/phosphonate ABC transporter substrate-binding protein [Anaerolineales bacterium]
MPHTQQSCKTRKAFLFLTLLFTLGCSLTSQTPTPTPQPTATLEATSAPPTQSPRPTPTAGSDQNPLLLALAPNPHPSADAISAANQLAAFIEKQSGYRVSAVAPPSELALIDALEKGNAHIVSLSPYGFALASERRLVSPLLARTLDGKIFYGAQFIVNRQSGFALYYDEARGENSADAAVALRQFADKKACWSDATSPSGYAIPLGVLNQAKVKIGGGAFLDGQIDVVRGVYAAGICDFGATFIDARKSPALESSYADATDKVKIVWRIPEIIPYENISMASALPFEMRRAVESAILDFALTPAGKSALQTLYGFDEMRHISDDAYAEFLKYMAASGLNLADLIK